MGTLYMDVFFYTWTSVFFHQFVMHMQIDVYYFLQTLLQDCLAPVAEDVCAEINKSTGAANTPLQKIIK